MFFACRTWKEVSGIRCWSPWNSWLVEVFSIRSLLRVIMYKNLSVHLVFPPKSNALLKHYKREKAMIQLMMLSECGMWMNDAAATFLTLYINSISIKSRKESLIWNDLKINWSLFRISRSFWGVSVSYLPRTSLQ